ncbi:MAG: hypothetical protein FJX72_20570 [Armatimonadetes bacterium]|nr:hypothetical protein [Armatimonadota bacterium]
MTRRRSRSPLLSPLFSPVAWRHVHLFGAIVFRVGGAKQVGGGESDGLDGGGGTLHFPAATVQ